MLLCLHFSSRVFVSFVTGAWEDFIVTRLNNIFDPLLHFQKKIFSMTIRMILVFGKNISQVVGITFNLMSSQQHSVKSKFERHLEMFDSSPKIRPH